MGTPARTNYFLILISMKFLLLAVRQWAIRPECHPKFKGPQGSLRVRAGMDKPQFAAKVTLNYTHFKIKPPLFEKPISCAILLADFNDSPWLPSIRPIRQIRPIYQLNAIDGIGPNRSYKTFKSYPPPPPAPPKQIKYLIHQVKPLTHLVLVTKMNYTAFFTCG